MAEKIRNADIELEPVRQAIARDEFRCDHVGSDLVQANPAQENGVQGQEAAEIDLSVVEMRVGNAGLETEPVAENALFDLGDGLDRFGGRWRLPIRSARRRGGKEWVSTGS